MTRLPHGSGILSLVLLCGCATIREPAPALCASGVCVVQGSPRDISRVCRLLHGRPADNCWDPYTRTAWVSGADALSMDICYAADSKTACEQELFR